MDNYYLKTTIKSYRKKVSLQIYILRILYIVLLPIFIYMFILLFLISFILINKKMTFEVINIFYHFYHKSKNIFDGSCYNTKGIFVPLTNNIIINLEECKKEKNIINTITHEDLHKAISNMGFGEESHWAIKRCVW